MALPLLSQGEYKLQTASLAVFGRYVSAMEDNGILDNGQSSPRDSRFARAPIAHSVKALEKTVQVFG